MAIESARVFYDELAENYHLIYRDWPAAIARQGQALDNLLASALGPRPLRILDTACGIGTQSLGLSALGHQVCAVDISPVAVARAAREARARRLPLHLAVADMRRLPWRPASFDAVVCADNALPHLLTATDLLTALGEMRRVLKPDGLLLVTTRDYDAIRAARPTATPPQVTTTPDGQVITFQLWTWHGEEHYDLEMFQVTERSGRWSFRIGRTGYWALTRRQLANFAGAAGFERPTWHTPEEAEFFQPVFTTRCSTTVNT